MFCDSTAHPKHEDVYPYHPTRPDDWLHRVVFIEKGETTELDRIQLILIYRDIPVTDLRSVGSV